MLVVRRVETAVGRWYLVVPSIGEPCWPEERSQQTERSREGDVQRTSRTRSVRAKRPGRSIRILHTVQYG